MLATTKTFFHKVFRRWQRVWRARRADYKRTWQQLTPNYRLAQLWVAATTDEKVFHETGLETVRVLESMVGLHPTDTVVEIGCGIGRVGKLIAPRVTRWIGLDVSRNMLQFATRALADLPNVSLRETDGYDLRCLMDESVDVVYCTVVFMHLDECDRFRYVLEAYRVLRPGGRLYVDNINLSHPEGWQRFWEVVHTPPLERPPQAGIPSLAMEFRLYGEKAGFSDVRIEGEDQFWLRMSARKSSPPSRTKGSADNDELTRMDETLPLPTESRSSRKDPGLAPPVGGVERYWI